MAKDGVAAPGPRTSIDPRLEGRLALAGRLTRWLAVLYCLLVLTGVMIRSVGDTLPEGPPTVRPTPLSTAVALIVLSLGSLLGGDTRQIGGIRLKLRRLGLWLSIATALFGAVVVGLFIADIPWPSGDVRDGPSFAMAVSMVALGLGVPLAVSRGEGRVVAGQVAALMVFSMSGVIFIGYTYGDPSLGRLFQLPEVTFQAALAAVLIAIGVLLIRPGRGLLQAASSPGAGGKVLRRFGPVVLLAPALLLLLVETVPATDRIDAQAVLAVSLGLLLLVLLGVLVRVIDKTAEDAATSGAVAERAQEGLDQEAPLASRLSDLVHIVDVADTGDWEVATRFRPAEGVVAGDASAVRTLPTGRRLGVVLVDVTGHGAEPAVRAIRIRDLLMHALALGQDPADAMTFLGSVTKTDELAAVVVARLDKTTGETLVASAGHTPAILIGAQDALLLGPTGPLLFLDPQVNYDDHDLSMDRGDSLVLFSDGVADIQVTRNGRTQPEILADILLAEGGVATRTAELVLGFGRPDPIDDQSAIVIRST